MKRKAYMIMNIKCNAFCDKTTVNMTDELSQSILAGTSETDTKITLSGQIFGLGTSRI
jgi:hypothetical protein